MPIHLGLVMVDPTTRSRLRSLARLLAGFLCLFLG